MIFIFSKHISKNVVSFSDKRTNMYAILQCLNRMRLTVSRNRSRSVIVFTCAREVKISGIFSRSFCFSSANVFKLACRERLKKWCVKLELQKQPIHLTAWCCKLQRKASSYGPHSWQSNLCWVRIFQLAHKHTHTSRSLHTAAFPKSPSQVCLLRCIAPFIRPIRRQHFISQETCLWL